MEQIQTSNNSNKMGTQPVGKLILSMSLPMMVSMLVLATYNVVDSIFVAKLSENALTAVSLVLPYQLLLVAVSVGTGVGVSSLVARRLGERRQADADSAAVHGQFLALVSGLVFTLLYALLTPLLIRIFQPDPEIEQYAVTYLYIVGCGCAFAGMQVMCEKTLQATGNTIHPMLIQLSGAIVNIVMDPILIFGLFGFPRMEVAGAAVATVAGQLVGMGLGYFFLLRSPLIRLTLKGFRPVKSTIAEIYQVGIPSIVMQAIGSLTTFFMNMILIPFTSTAVSVLGVYFKLQSFVFMPVFGLNAGTMPILGYNYGARNRERLVRALKLGCLYALVVMVLGLLLFQFFARELLLCFDASDYMLEIGVPALRTISLCFPSAALCIMFSTLFQAIGQGFYSLLISVFRQLLLILPVAWFLSVQYGLSAVWWAYPIAECGAFVLSTLLLVRAYRSCIVPLAPLSAEGGAA